MLRTFFICLATLLAHATLIGTAVAAEKVRVLTSFPPQFFESFQKEFRKRHPAVAIEFVQRKTTTALADIVGDRHKADIFWASAPDAFEVLKGKGLLQKYKPKAEGIPEKIGSYPINDPENFYSGFAASGYGIMWNDRYAKANKLPEPKDWQDLAKPVYFDHVAMAAPSRSGTTHLTIETVLQGEGWDQGWRTLKGCCQLDAGSPKLLLRILQASSSQPTRRTPVASRQELKA